MSKNDMKEIVDDVVAASTETGMTLIVENLPTLGKEVAKIISNDALSTTIQTLTGGVIGAVAPAFLGAALSFQHKRLEHNMLRMIRSIEEKQEIIQKRLDALQPEVCQKFISGVYCNALLDNIVSENQEQKVQDNINGFINLMAVENPNDDMVFTFFSTLSQMNELDIRILKLYEPIWKKDEETSENCRDIMEDENIDHMQYNFIREKLCRLGMLYSKNEEKRNKNIEALEKTLTELIKQMSSKNPNKVNVPRIERITSSDSYAITKLGNEYLEFISEPQ